jgi:hypothetical protein
MVEKFDMPVPSLGISIKVVTATDYEALEADKADDVRRMADDQNKIWCLTNRVAALEAAVREWASECADCDGRGFFTSACELKRHNCESCAHIRELLTPTTAKTKGDV